MLKQLAYVGAQHSPNAPSGFDCRCGWIHSLLRHTTRTGRGADGRTSSVRVAAADLPEYAFGGSVRPPATQLPLDFRVGSVHYYLYSRESLSYDDMTNVVVVMCVWC